MTTHPATPAYRFLQEIADDLSSGDLSFPTFLDATLKVRMALNTPNLTAEALARLVGTEPLLSVKLIRLANSAALNPGGKPVSDIKTAVIRVGFASVRTLAITVAMGQLLKSTEMAAHADGAKALWRHSIEVAALCFVLAKRLACANPHEAMFAGLVHDIGQFYLLSRIAGRPDIAPGSSELSRLLFEWHASVGHAVLTALGAPEAIVAAVDEHEVRFEGGQPRSLAQVVFAANQLAENRNPYVGEAEDDAVGEGGVPALGLDVQLMTEIIAESRAEMDSLVATLGL